MPRFLFLNPKLHIVQNIDGLLLWRSNPIDKDQIYQIDKFGAEIIRRCSGTLTVEEIKADLEAIYDTVGFDLPSAFEKFFEDCESLDILFFSDVPQKHIYHISGNPDAITPVHYSLEITSSCNLRCQYCYLDDKLDQEKNIDYKTLRNIFPDLMRNGVQTIELTGGEPTLHPNFVEIVMECTQIFSFVAIISNGTLLWKFVKALSECLRDKILFQVDLDGPNSRIHDHISRTHGAFKNVIRSIQALVKKRFHVKAVMNVYKQNFNFMEDTLQLAKSLNVDRFSCSPVIKMGRAKEIDVLDEKDFGIFFKKIESFGKRFPNLYSETKEGVPYYRLDIPHCGAGWKSLTIDPKGNIRVCPMASTIAHKLGNIYSDNYSSFLKNATNSMIRYKRIKVPNIETCGECESINFCLGCFVRPFYVIERNKDNADFYCSWNHCYSIY